MPELLLHVSANELEVGIEIVEAGEDAYRRWLALAGSVLASAFAGRPLWFVADWERARAWAFPEALEVMCGESNVIVDGVSFRLAFSQRCDAALLRQYVASGDFRTDSILLVPDDRFAEAALHKAIRETTTLDHGRTRGLTANVATTIGDGAGIVWYNHGRAPDSFRVEIETLAAEGGFSVVDSTRVEPDSYVDS